MLAKMQGVFFSYRRHLLHCDGHFGIIGSAEARHYAAEARARERKENKPSIYPAAHRPQ